jgi:endonuclease/exonuclease/phosphatase family metal-dependent hydrolase
VLGDLNSNPTSSAARGGEHFRRILADGWRRATPTGGASYFGHSGRRSEIDHMLCNGGRGFIDSRYVIEARGWRLAGGEGALSDHAALLADILND